MMNMDLKNLCLADLYAGHKYAREQYVFWARQYDVNGDKDDTQEVLGEIGKWSIIASDFDLELHNRLSALHEKATSKTA